jgi:uncharacterized protein
MRKFLAFHLVALLLIATTSHAQEAKPIKALMFVGGCCHDYKKMPGYLAERIGAIANIKFEIRPMENAAEMAEVFKDPHFADGFDVVVYDICFGEAWKDGDYDNVLKTAAAGKPAVFVHCAMHTYRPPRDEKSPEYKNRAEREAIADAKWHAIVGMDTRVHDKYEPFTVENIAKNHPIVRSWSSVWTTTGDELYNTVKMMPTATPLLQAKSPASGKVHTVAWINDYHGTRIFGTTLGHDMKTGEDPAYHRLLAYGILWTCGKLTDDGGPVYGYAGSRQ